MSDSTIPQINTIDINNVVAPKKTRKPRARKQGKPAETATEETESILNPLSEKERLQEELMRLADYNAEVVTKPVNDKVAKLVEEMDIEELKARIRVGKRKQSGKMDNSFAEQTIHLCNQMTGRMLGCLNELNETSLKDELLKDATKEYLCINVLDYIPIELKLGGIYGSHVAQAYYKAQAEMTPKITELDPKKLEEMKEKLSSPDMMNKLTLLKEKLSTLNVKPDE